MGIVNNWLVGTYGTQEVFEKILLWPFICRIFVDFLGKRKYIFDMHNSMDIFSVWLTFMLFSYTKHIDYIILDYNYSIGRNSGLGSCTSLLRKSNSQRNKNHFWCVNDVFNSYQHIYPITNFYTFYDSTYSHKVVCRR